MSYRDIGGFLSGFSILSLILYFVTSSDSGSLVIDCLASNGHPEPPRLQRLLWALLEGITATALLVAGGQKALSALQAMSIATGFIYTILICIACVALWRSLKTESGFATQSGQLFQIGILDPFFTDPFKHLSSSWRDNSRLFGKFLTNIFLAPFTVAKSVVRMQRGTTGDFIKYFVPLALPFLLFIILHVVQVASDGTFVFGWIFYISKFTNMTLFHLLHMMYCFSVLCWSVISEI